MMKTVKILAVIDMQKDFTTGVLGNPQTAAAADAVAEKIRAYKAQFPGVPVVYTMDTHTEEYLDTQEGKNLPVVHCVKGTDGWQLDPKVAEVINEKDIMVEKPAFGAVDLAEYVRQAAGDIEKIGSIELVGVCTDICVISNAMILKAAFAEIPLTVDSKCCAGVSPESHDNALKAMEVCQIKIV